MSPRLRPDVATTDTEHGTVLLDERTGRYYQLNPTGARVLRGLLDGHSPDRIADGLANDHHLDHGRARHDVTALLDRLRTANLVVEP
ncbi:lasso peptide biosynthesis PqqD family chaperone [Saccharothrix xinjiangensis]|uniref:Lasso peptide biosynthesis PqqD family chaperone n=1 Tax=Saccharothrix xinjiangensis TaxID=204798 RepID=A0ABV9XY41_9PSEU